MVEVSSVNPSFQRPDGPAAWSGEAKLAAFILEWLRAGGIDGRLEEEGRCPAVGRHPAIDDLRGLDGVRRRRASQDLAALVPFDAGIDDRATFDYPTEISVGVEELWVGGETVLAAGRPTSVRPGKFL